MLKKNDDYFNKKTLQSAYWAGFIAADGCVFPPENKLSIEISSADSDHLQKFVDDIQWEGIVRYRERTYGKMCRVQIGSSKQFIQDLDEIYNITQAKTQTLQPPNIDGQLKLAYLVGLIDGDGCIGVDRKGKYTYTRLTITTASRDLADWLNVELNALCSREGNSVYKAGKAWNVVFSGRYADKIISELRMVNVTRLDRKWVIKDSDDYVDTEEVA